MMKRQAYKHLLTKARTWSRTYLSGAHIKMPNSLLSAIWHFAFEILATEWRQYATASSLINQACQGTISLALFFPTYAKMRDCYVVCLGRNQVLQVVPLIL